MPGAGSRVVRSSHMGVVQNKVPGNGPFAGLSRSFRGPMFSFRGASSFGASSVGASSFGASFLGASSVGPFSVISSFVSSAGAVGSGVS